MSRAPQSRGSIAWLKRGRKRTPTNREIIMGEITPQFIRSATLRLNPADDVVIAARDIAAGTLIALKA